MGRPRGMKKIDGIWYMPNGEIAPSSKSKVNNAEGYSDTTNVITVAHKPAESVTGPSENATTEISRGTGRLEVQEVATGTIVGGKVQGMHLYTMEEIKRVETQTGLMFVGEFAEQQGALIPVFLNPNQSEEDRKAKLTKIRQGI